MSPSPGSKRDRRRPSGSPGPEPMKPCLPGKADRRRGVPSRAGPARCSCGWTPAASARPTSRRSRRASCPGRASSATRSRAPWPRSGAGTKGFREGQRVVVHHHVPCGDLLLLRARGCTPSAPSTRRTAPRPASSPRAAATRSTCGRSTGSWSGARSPIPDGVLPEEAAFVEPVNTCLKAVRKAGVAKGESRARRGPGADRPAAHAARALGRGRGGGLRPAAPSGARSPPSLGARVALDAAGDVPARGARA